MSLETFCIVLSVNSFICYVSWTENQIFFPIFAMNFTKKNARLTSRIEIESCSQVKLFGFMTATEELPFREKKSLIFGK